MELNRRQFGMVLGGGLAAGGPTVLQAIVAPSIPRFLTVAGVRIAPDDPRIFEVRVYESPARSLDSVFQRSGIQPMLRETSGAKATYLIPFESLAARENAWTKLNTHPEWIEMRSEAGRVSEVAIYRRYLYPIYPGGRIFEMSL